MVFKYLAFLFVKDQKCKVFMDHIFSIVDTLLGNILSSISS
jgi:hypothetical protein